MVWFDVDAACACVFFCNFAHPRSQLGKVPEETVSVVDLGGGSSQIMYAVGYVRSMGGG